MSLKENDIYREQRLEQLQEYVAAGLLTQKELDRLLQDGESAEEKEEIKGRYEQYKKTHETL